MTSHLTTSSQRQGQCVSSPSDINILLLGQSGVGKTTLINAFANYLPYNTLDDAMRGELQAPITASFTYTDNSEDNLPDREIVIGSPDDEEKGDTGESCTRVCRSFVFEINGKRLRLIDTPGVGDTRGVSQDETNFTDILAYISQFEHLNGICILFKPNETRFNVLLRFCIKELLRHLHVNAKENIMFVFTNARTTLYKPGESIRLIRKLILEIQTELNIIISFTTDNTFLLDNEPFRFLALVKNKIEVSDEDKAAYKKSWDKTVIEFHRLVAYITKCKKHITRETISLNDAQQLIRRLSRPVGEITTLIEANKNLAKQYKDSISSDKNKATKEIPQMDAEIVELGYPRTVCTNKKCTETTLINGLYKVDYIRHCHPHCYLSGVEEERIGDEKLRECAAMERWSDKCRMCGCERKEHMHVMYELRKFVRQVAINSNNGNVTESDIEIYIKKLDAEKKAIIKVCSQIAYFIQKNSLIPINNDVLEYIEHFIREENQKKTAGADNEVIIAQLENLKKDYLEEKECFKQAMEHNQSATTDPNTIITPEKVFSLVKTLYELPINGRKIQSQVEHLARVQQTARYNREKTVNLPENAGSSTMMTNIQKELQ